MTIVDFMILGIHRQIAAKVDVEKVMNQFSEKFPQCRIELY